MKNPAKDSILSFYAPDFHHKTICEALIWIKFSRISQQLNIE